LPSARYWWELVKFVSKIFRGFAVGSSRSQKILGLTSAQPHPPKRKRSGLFFKFFSTAFLLAATIFMYL
jgi:hypothetical protein